MKDTRIPSITSRARSPAASCHGRRSSQLVLWRALRAPRKADSRLTYLLIWFVVVLGFYSFSHSKRGVYLLPLYPALATIIALYLVDAIDAPASRRGWSDFSPHCMVRCWRSPDPRALLALAMLMALAARRLPRSFRTGGITEVGFHSMRCELPAFSQPYLSIAIAIGRVASGVYLIRSTSAAHKMMLAIAGGNGFPRARGKRRWSIPRSRIRWRSRLHRRRDENRR